MSDHFRNGKLNHPWYRDDCTLCQSAKNGIVTVNITLGPPSKELMDAIWSQYRIGVANGTAQPYPGGLDLGVVKKP